VFFDEIGSFIQADFRLRSPTPDARDRVEDVDSGEIMEIDGDMLNNAGLYTTLEPRESRLIFYSKIK